MVGYMRKFANQRKRKKKMPNPATQTLSIITVMCILPVFFICIFYIVAIYNLYLSLIQHWHY